MCRRRPVTCCETCGRPYRVGAEDGSDFLQRFATHYLSFDGEAAPLVIGKQDALLTKLLFEYLVLGAQVFEDFLLKPVDPSPGARGKGGDAVHLNFYAPANTLTATATALTITVLDADSRE